METRYIKIVEDVYTQESCDRLAYIIRALAKAGGCSIEETDEFLKVTASGDDLAAIDYLGEIDAGDIRAELTDD